MRKRSVMPWSVMFTVLILWGCKQEPTDKVEQETSASTPIVDAGSPDVTTSKEEAPPVEARGGKEEEAKDSKLVRTYESALISEEYHSLTVKWAGPDDTRKVTLHEKPEDGSPELASIVVRKGAPLLSREDRVIVEKPRAFKPSKEVEVGLFGEGGEQKVKLSPPDALHVYKYEGEGMCEVVIIPKGGAPQFGSATCPDNGYAGMTWTTSEQGRRDLPEEATWWMLLDGPEGAQRGWAKFDLGELDLDLKINERLAK